MSSKLVEAVIMHRHMGKYDKLGCNIHVFTGNNAVEGNLKE